MSIVTNTTVAASSSNDAAFSFSNLPPQLAFIHETSPFVLAGSTFLIIPLLVIVINVAWQLVSRLLCVPHHPFCSSAWNHSSSPGIRHYRLSCSIGCPGLVLPFPTAMTLSTFSFRAAKRCVKTGLSPEYTQSDEFIRSMVMYIHLYCSDVRLPSALVQRGAT